MEEKLVKLFDQLLSILWHCDIFWYFVAFVSFRDILWHFLQIRSQEKYVESSHYTSTDLSGGGDILVEDISRDQSPRPMSEMSSCWDDSEINSQEVKRREHNHKLQVVIIQLMRSRWR